MSILIVDDSLAHTVLLQTLLKRVGYNDIFIASSAKTAFEILGWNDPNRSPDVDLILMDIGMPVVTGIEACRIIKSTPHIRDIPVIMVTAKSDISSLKLAFSAGALDYIMKPVKAAELLARVHSAINLKQEMDKRKARERELSEINKLFRTEQEKTEKLILNVLPPKIADDLKNFNHTRPKLYSEASVLFCNFINFSKLSRMLSPKDLVRELNDIYTGFDDILERNGCLRIKTISDTYIAASGLPEEDPDHARNLTRASLSMIEFIKHRNRKTLMQWQIKIGIHSGNLIGAVVGVKKYIFDIFGDTVNTAARMEENSELMKVNVSEATNHLVRGAFQWEERPPLFVKGKGRMRMFFVKNAL